MIRGRNGTDEAEMRIYIGADHKGFSLKEHLVKYLQGEGYEVTDVGTGSETSTDYPDYGLEVACAVAEGRADRGIAICWTGNGMNIAANKVPGMRSALCVSTDMAMMARAHNNANMLALGSRYVSSEEAEKIVFVFLSTVFEGGRHAKRLAKIEAAEKK